MNTEKDNDHDSQLYLIAGAIADQEEIDWHAAESSAPEEQRPLVHFLKIISGIPRAHHLEQESQAESTAETFTSWGPLQIIRKVGQGVFGEVFRARDPRLDREVALKLFYPRRSSQSRPAEELIEEGRLLARVRHPNVAVVHGAEQHEDRVGIWMEFIEGTTLDQYIGEKGTLDPAEAMAIGRDVCRALQAVHQAEVIHRDIKASNVMREQGGRIVVLDLGASRDTSRVDSERIYGTPFYAAPEVLLENRTSRASDIYSVGVLVYFMLTGLYPVSGRSVDDIREAHEQGQVQGLRNFRPDLPEPLLRIVDRALSPEPADRLQSAGQFELALTRALEAAQRAHWIVRHGRWLLPLAAIAALVFAFTLGPLRDWRGTVPPGGTSLAVLLFENLGPPGRDDYLVAGLTDDLITSLTRFDGLEVLSRRAVQHYRYQEIDPQEIGRALRVDYILDGSLQRVGDELHVTAQIVEAGSGSRVWADRFDFEFANLIAIQDTVATLVGAELGIASVGDPKAPVGRRWTENAETYSHFLIGRELMWHGIDRWEWEESPQWFEKALAIDPDYAPALAALAHVTADGNLNRKPGYQKRALELADRALQLDPSLAEPWLARGSVHLARGELDQAQAAYEKALALNPQLPETYMTLYWFLWQERGDLVRAVDIARQGVADHPYWEVSYWGLANILRFLGEYDEMDRVLQEGMARLPENPRMLSTCGAIHHYSSRYEEAILVCQRLIDTRLDYLMAYQGMGEVLGKTGRYAEADSFYLLTIERWPEDPESYSEAAKYLHGRRRYAEAEPLLRKAVSLNENHFQSTWLLGSCLHRLGRTDEAEAVMLDMVARWPESTFSYDRICNFYMNVVEDLEQTEKWVTEMLRRFPELGLSYSWLGWYHWLKGELEPAVEAFQRAIAIRSVNYQDHRGLCQALRDLDRQEEALEVARSWVNQCPRHLGGWRLLGTAYRSLGRYHQAAAAFERVLELDPEGVLTAGAVRDLAVIYGDEGRYAKQIETLRRAVAIDSTDVYTWRQIAEAAWIGLQDGSLARTAAHTSIQLPRHEIADNWAVAYSHLVLGDIAASEKDEQTAATHYESAREAIKSYLAVYNETPDGMSCAGRIYLRTADVTRALECAGWLEENQRRDPAKCYHAACIFAAAGELERGLASLEAAVAAGYRNQGYLQNDPDLERLRSDPRFKQIIDSIR